MLLILEPYEQTRRLTDMHISSINGVTSVTVSVIDRGLHYGDGVFETIKCIDRQLYYWPQHYSRLHDSAEKLGIACPDESLLIEDIRKLMAEQEADDVVVKIIITRGLGERGYRYASNIQPTRIVQLSGLLQPDVRLQTEGIMATVSDHRLSENSQLAGIKHLNRLDNVLARNGIHDRFHEGVMLDQQGRVVEGTMSNIFLVKHGSLLTPELKHCGIDGIIRNRIIELAKDDGITTEIMDIETQLLYEADECFFSNSLIDIWPVQSIDDHRYHSQASAHRLLNLLQQSAPDYVTHL